MLVILVCLWAYFYAFIVAIIPLDHQLEKFSPKNVNQIAFISGREGEVVEKNGLLLFSFHWYNSVIDRIVSI